MVMTFPLRAAALAAVLVVSVAGCQQTQRQIPPSGPTGPGNSLTNPPAVPPGLTPPTPSPVAFPSQHLVELAGSITRFSVSLDTASALVKGAYSAVTVSCPLPKVDTNTGQRQAFLALLSGGYDSAGAIVVHDSFPSTAFGEPVADSGIATSWTVIFAKVDTGAPSSPNDRQAGTAWVNCSDDPALATSVYRATFAKVGTNRVAEAVCPADRSLTGGGYQSGWDAIYGQTSTVRASFPDPYQPRSWAVYESTVPDSGAPTGTAFAVCGKHTVAASGSFSTTVVDRAQVVLEPSSICTQAPLWQCSENREGSATIDCPTGRLVGGGVISLKTVSPASVGIGPQPAPVLAVDPWLRVSLDAPGGLWAQKEVWALGVHLRRVGLDPGDPSLKTRVTLRTVALCAT
jgi:hypothetical protein